MKNVDHFSLYLMIADSLPPYGWNRNTYFKLALVNQLDVNKSVVKGNISLTNCSLLCCSCNMILSWQ